MINRLTYKPTIIKNDKKLKKDYADKLILYKLLTTNLFCTSFFMFSKFNLLIEDSDDLPSLALAFVFVAGKVYCCCYYNYKCCYYCLLF